MATITSNAYNDDASRTAGETIAISSGAKFTIRTDTRLHSNAPASMTGSMGSVSFTDIGGEYAIDATTVRWMSFDSGTGNVPTIGTSITQGAVSGYLLGVWSSISATPTASGSAMPASGFIKFREVTGGTFTTGALTGIGASATAADVAGWIEIVYDAATNIVVPRVGKFSSRGTWFELGATNGSVAQEFIVPSTSSALTNNFLPGAWIETTNGSGVYEFWTGLSTTATGWTYKNIGQPRSDVDKRCKFVKTSGSGKIIIGENVDVSGTYANVAAQASTYTNYTISSTYVWADDKMTVTTGTTTHLLEDGMSVGLQITSGEGTTGIYTVTVLDQYRFEVTLVGSGTGGNVTFRPGQTITFTAHGLLEGEQIYCDFTSGTGVDGVYTVWRRTSANAYVISYPSTASITAGNVSTRHTVTVTSTAHGLAVGNKVQLNHTSGSGTNGIYTIKTVATDTFTVNMTHSGNISGNVTIEFTLGYIPPTGCKVRIPNIFIAECATGSRATNSVPNATLASRPEITTTNAGAIDLEYLYALSLYTGAIGQAYSLRLYHCGFVDNLNISEIATALDIDDVGVGMYSAPDARSINFTSCFAGGTVKNIVAQRAHIGTTDHAFDLVYCSGITLTNVRMGIIQYARNTGLACVLTTCQNIIINGLNVFNGSVSIVTSVDITITDMDYNDRYIGRTNSTSPYYAFNIAAGCDNISLNGLTFGLENTLEDCHPFSGAIYATGATNLKFRNIGSYASPVTGGTWAIDTYGMAYAIYVAGNCNTVKCQKIYTTRLRTAFIYTLNSNKNIIYDRVFTKYGFVNSGTGTPRTALALAVADLNCSIKGVFTGLYPTTGQASVYGTHWQDMFTSAYKGSLVLVMNEATTETSSYVTINSGTGTKFNSAGGIEMRTIGDQCTWEMPYFSKGHSSFENITPVMSGGTIGNYTLEYKIDLGSGYSVSWATLSGTNLSAHDLSNGFKLQIRITTTSTNTSAITFLRLYTNSSSALQSAIDYPLETVTVSVTVKDAATGLPIENAIVYVIADTGGDLTPGTAIINKILTNSSGIAQNTSFELSGTTQPVTGRVRKGTASPFYKTSLVSGTITSSGLAVTVFMVSDE